MTRMYPRERLNLLEVMLRRIWNGESIRGVCEIYDITENDCMSGLPRTLYWDLLD